MKKTLLILMAIVLAFAMLACSKDDKTNQDDNNNNTITDNQNPDNSTDDELLDGTNDDKNLADGDENADSNADQSTETVTLDSSLDVILTTIINGVVPEELWTETAEITDETFQNFFFIEPIEDYEAWVNVAGMSSIAHEVSLIRVSEGTDVEALATEIENNLNPRKWVCVDAEKTAVVVRGNVILVTMSRTEIVDGAVANFKAL